ncbi:hypothetical protein GCM10027063_42900 [Promicromonospora xylanilytica]
MTWVTEGPPRLRRPPRGGTGDAADDVADRDQVPLAERAAGDSQDHVARLRGVQPDHPGTVDRRGTAGLRR